MSRIERLPRIRGGELSAGILRGIAVGCSLSGIAAATSAGVGSADAGPADALRLAYLDPGAGSFILQALVAAIAGAIVTINAYWTKIKRLLGLAETEKQDTSADSNGE